MFIFDAILESMTCGNTQVPTAKLRSALQQLGSLNPETGMTGFQQQFDVSFFASKIALPHLIRLLLAYRS